MASKRALKPKSVSRIDELQWKHPGDITEAEKLELAKLIALRNKYGAKTN